MQHLHSYNNFELILEKESKGVMSSLWSVLTLGGYVTSKMKNVFGMKSILIKNKLSKIEDILRKGLQNLPLVFPSQRVVQSAVDKNDAFKRFKDTIKNSNPTISAAMEDLMFEIEKSILIYEEDKDLNLIHDEVEQICNEYVSSKKIDTTRIPKLKAEIIQHVKTLRLNKKLVQDMTQRLPRYDMKNYALEASILIKADEDARRDNRLALLFQKRKNALYSKYEKYYDFDELNNWLDYDRFDPNSVKYREQVDAAKKISDAIIKKNHISNVMPMQNFTPHVGGKYYFFFEEDLEWRAILAELISIDNDSKIKMYKPYGIYRVSKKDKFEFRRIYKKELKGVSKFAQVEYIDTKMYMLNNTAYFVKNDLFFSKVERLFKFNEVASENEFKDITFNFNNLKGLGVFKMEDEVSNDKIDTDNWKKYEIGDFTTGLSAIKKLVNKFGVKASSATASQSTEAPKENKEEQKGGFKVRKLKVADKEYLESIYSDMLRDFTAAVKTMMIKMKDEEISEFLRKYLQDGVNKYPREFDTILANATKALLKRKK